MATTPRIAVFPGSFDPPTLGHVDIVQRAAKLYDRVVVGILENPSKRSLLTLEARRDLFRAALADAGVADVSFDVQTFSGLAIDFAATAGAGWIIRGVRSGRDLDDEWPMAMTNLGASDERVETVLLPARPELAHIQSRLVRQLAAGGGSVAGLVPAVVAEHLENAGRSESSSGRGKQ